jgi:hypothetical protein
MNIKTFVKQVQSGEIQIVVGGKINGEAVSGYAEPDSLKNEEIAAEANASGVSDIAGLSFEELTNLVASLRANADSEPSEFSARARKKKRIYKRKKTPAKLDA